MLGFLFAGRRQRAIAASLFTALLLFASGATAQDKPKRAAKRDGPAKGRAANTEILRDIEYARPDGLPQLLDLYLPKGDNPKPVVVWIHGGAWKQGDKRNCPARFLTSTGYAVASINYRLSQEAKYPAQIHDCKAAIVWLKKNAKRYRLDASRIGVWGSSAGGHLAALVGVSADVEQLTPPAERLAATDSRVQAVCDFFGPTDFLQMDRHAQPNAPIVHDDPKSPESLLIDGAIQQHPDRVRKANPITFVSRDDPPFLIMHGDRDPLVPLHQSRILHEALQKAEVNSTLRVVKGAGHGLRGPEIQQQVKRFFDVHLRAAKPQESTADDKEDAPPAEAKKTQAPTRDFNPVTVIPRHIRPIVNAPSIPADKVTDQVGDNDLVLGVLVGKQSRAYPINMLSGPSREIINDDLGNRSIAATW